MGKVTVYKPFCENPSTTEDLEVVLEENLNNNQIDDEILINKFKSQNKLKLGDIVSIQIETKCMFYKICEFGDDEINIDIIDNKRFINDDDLMINLTSKEDLKELSTFAKVKEEAIILPISKSQGNENPKKQYISVFAELKKKQEIIKQREIEKQQNK